MLLPLLQVLGIGAFLEIVESQHAKQLQGRDSIAASNAKHPDWQLASTSQLQDGGPFSSEQSSRDRP